MIIQAMAKDLSVDEGYIRKVSARSNHYYRHFTIPKSSGGERDIWHPSPVLKAFQYWLVKRVFSVFAVSEWAVAYKKGSSIKANAAIHSSARHLLHLDIKDFFPSINKSMLESLLRNGVISGNRSLPATEDDIRVIAGLCLHKERLAVGSVCAPVISNAVMFTFDQAVKKLADEKGLAYTRYADDMVFSGPSFITADFPTLVETLALRQGFRLNTSKTLFMSSRMRKTVTGLTTNAGHPSIGRARKDNIKKLLYEYLKHGTGDPQKIIGHLQFLRDVEPGVFNSYIIKFCKIFKKNVIKALLESVSDSVAVAAPKSRVEAAATKAPSRKQ